MRPRRAQEDHAVSGHPIAGPGVDGGFAPPAPVTPAGDALLDDGTWGPVSTGTVRSDGDMFAWALPEGTPYSDVVLPFPNSAYEDRSLSGREYEKRPRVPYDSASTTATYEWVSGAQNWLLNSEYGFDISFRFGYHLHRSSATNGSSSMRPVWFGLRDATAAPALHTEPAIEQCDNGFGFYADGAAYYEAPDSQTGFSLMGDGVYYDVLSHGQNGDGLRYDIEYDNLTATDYEYAWVAYEDGTAALGLTFGGGAFHGTRTFGDAAWAAVHGPVVGVIHAVADFPYSAPVFTDDQYAGNMNLAYQIAASWLPDFTLNTGWYYAVRWGDFPKYAPEFIATESSGAAVTPTETPTGLVFYDKSLYRLTLTGEQGASTVEATLTNEETDEEVTHSFTARSDAMNFIQGFTSTTSSTGTNGFTYFEFRCLIKDVV